MTKRNIYKLVNISYKNNLLDKNIVLKISNKLSRRDLKLYLKALKINEQKNTIKVIMANDKINKILLEKKLKQEFGNKIYDYKIDKSLIAGIKIIDNDLIYDFSLNNTIDNLVTYINN